MFMSASHITLTGISPTIQGLHWEAAQYLRIGRQQDLEVVLSDPSVSREHAEIYYSPKGWLVRDLHSTQGTLVNGVPVEKGTRRLHQEDMLQCGKLVLHVDRLEEEALRLPAMPKGPANIKTTGPIVCIQSQSERSWEQGLRELDPSDPKMAQGRQLLTLLRGGYHLSRIHNLGELLQTLLNDIATVLEARRGAILLADEATGLLGPRAIFAPGGLAPGERPYSSTLAQRCFAKGESFLCHDVADGTEPKEAGCAREGTKASIICTLLRSPRRRLGVLHVDRADPQPRFSQEQFALAEAITTSIALAVETALAVERQRDALFPITQGLARLVLELRQRGMARHGERVGNLAALLGEEMGLPRETTRLLQIGGLLHDLGKEDSIFANGEEDADHPARGAAMVEGIAGLESFGPLLRHHHERWDGSGYPNGLAGEAIPRPARIVAVAEALEELVRRENALPGSLGDAIQQIAQHSATHFDPECVCALQRCQSRIETEWDCPDGA
jgi:GAF domain-containing protein